MNWQYLIVGLIIMAALVYAASGIFRKLKAFGLRKGSCDHGCGCDGGRQKDASRF